MYKIKYEGYDGNYVLPSYDRESAYANDAYYPADIGYAGEPEYFEGEKTIYTPDQYYYEPLENYVDSPLNDPYY